MRSHSGTSHSAMPVTTETSAASGKIAVLPVIGMSALVSSAAAGLIATMSQTRRIDVTALAGE